MSLAAVQSSFWKPQQSAVNLALRRPTEPIMNMDRSLSNLGQHNRSAAACAVGPLNMSRGDWDAQLNQEHLQQHNARTAVPCTRTSPKYSIGDQSTQFVMTDPSHMFTSNLPIKVKETLNPQMNIIHLPGDCYLSLVRELNRSEYWRRLVFATENTDFTTSMSTVNDFEHKADPSRELLTHYSGRGMNVQTLTELLDKAELHSTMELLRQPEMVRIVQRPAPPVDISEGETLVLSCEAVGFPPPQYQWYHHRAGQTHKLHLQTTKNLTVPNIRMDQSGSYACQAYNMYTPNSNFPQSTWTTVTVAQAPFDKTRLNKCGVGVRIIRQTEMPQLTVYAGHILQLECHAESLTIPTYQWYRNGILLPQQNKPVLRLVVEPLKYTGNYVCLVNGTLQSRPVYVCVIEPGTPMSAAGHLPYGQHIRREQHTVQAKVALLVGTQKYHVHEHLPAPRNDVVTLETHLRGMGFMVLTLLDLTKGELIQHVKWFCELLGEGVYGLFFYIGHGFNRSGQSFLIPWDAQVGCKMSDCVHLEKDVLTPILLRSPAMCFAIIDICRESLPHLPENEQPEEVTLPANDTTCIFYTTSPGYKSFESQEMEKGIFMMHLSKFINEKISVQDLYTKVRKEIKMDPDAGVCQFPIMECHLSNTLSLHDPIDTRGHTVKMESRQRIWESAQLLPESKRIQLTKLGVTMRITFTKLLSNVMCMTTTVIEMGLIQSYSFKVIDVPPEIVGSHDTFQNIDRPRIPFSAVFQDLQRLRNPLRPTLRMEMMFNGEPLVHDEKLDLEEPLVARLHFNALKTSRPCASELAEKPQACSIGKDGSIPDN